VKRFEEQRGGNEEDDEDDDCRPHLNLLFMDIS